MLQDNEVLDAVFSFLDLPALDEEGLTSLDIGGVLSPRPPERLTLAIEEDHSLEGLYGPQTNAPLDASLADNALDLGVLVENSPPTATVLSPTSSEDSSQSSKGKKKTDNKKPSHPRITQKQRIETLREIVRGLSAELQRLRPDRGSMTRSVDRQLIPRQTSMWEQIAARQLERRRQYEEENAKLRKMLQIQMQEARSLRRMLKRRTKIDMMEDMLGMKRHKMLDYGIPKDNSEVFKAMLRDVDELYVGADALCAEKEVYTLPCPGRQREARRSATDGVFLELTQRHLVPFDLGTTDKAMHKVMRQMGFDGLRSIEGRVQFHSHHIEESSNTIKTSVFADAANLGDVRGAQFRKVVQKYVETDRVVFICKALVEPVLLKTGSTSGFRTRTTLRIVLREESPRSAAEKAVTRIESHFSATRYDLGLPDANSVRVSSNLDVGTAGWDEAISRMAHQVESLALDESCEKSSSLVLRVQ